MHFVVTIHFCPTVIKKFENPPTLLVQIVLAHNVQFLENPPTLFVQIVLAHNGQFLENLPTLLVHIL